MAEPSGRDRREFHRIPETIEGRYRVSGDFSGLGRPMTILNFSASGLRFCADELIEQETMLELEAKIPGLRNLLRVKGQVVWSVLRTPGVAEMGVEFMDVSPEQQYQLDSIVEFFRGSSRPPSTPA